MPSILEHFTTNKSAPNHVNSRFPNWDASSLIHKAANPAYRSRQKLVNLLKADWYSFSAEYIKAELTTQIPMTLKSDLGIMGMSSSYQEGLNQQGQGFITKLKKQGKEISRAEIENHNLAQLNQWSLTAPVHSLFVWHSPPGKESEGYCGKEAHSFTFVYEKTSKDKVVLHQFRSWMSLQDHQQLQQFIGKPLPNNPQLPRDYATINNTTVINPPKNHSTTQAKNWADTTVDKIKTFIYNTNNNWRVKPAELPQVPEEEYQAFSDFLISLYIRKIVPLLLKNVPKKTAVDSDWKNFCDSAQHRLLVEQLDVAFAFLAYQPLLKFVELTNEAEPTNQGLIQSDLSQISSGDKEVSNDLVTLPFNELEDRLLFLYQLKFKELAGESLTDQESDRFNLYGSSLLSAVNNTFSKGQCGVGTLFPTQLANSGMLKNLSSLSSFSPAQLSQLESGQFTLQEKQKRLAELQSYRPLYIYNKDTNQTETWYVKVLNPDEFEAYVHGCFIENQQIFGPCRDHNGKAIPLTPGPVPLEEIDQQIDIFTLIPAAEYQQYLQMLEHTQADEYFAEELKNKSLEEVLLNQAESAAEKRKIKQLLKTARSLLSNKQVVAVTELLSGEIYHPLLKGVLNQLSKYAPMDFILNSLIKERGGNLTDSTTTTMTTAQASPATV